MIEPIICRSAKADCYNILDSQGEICTGCNCCGRIDQATMYQCRIDTEKAYLVELMNDLVSAGYQSKYQQDNILHDIETGCRKIREARVLNEKV
jgi:predicted PP-loop superfamily ATPase